jgi:hypothetical protein
MVALGAPLLVSVLLLEADSSERVFVHGPIVISGWVGILAGAAVAQRVTIPALALEVCRRNLRISAALLGAVVLVLAAAVIPLTAKAGTSPDGTPGDALAVFRALAVLGIVVSALLALIAVRAGRGRRPSPVVLGLLGLIAFVPVCFLSISAFTFPGHGPVLLTASVLLFLCLAAELVATALVAATALRLAAHEPA